MILIRWRRINCRWYNSPNFRRKLVRKNFLCPNNQITAIPRSAISHFDWLTSRGEVAGVPEGWVSEARDTVGTEKNSFDVGNGWGGGEKVSAAITHRSHLIYLVSVTGNSIVPRSTPRRILQDWILTRDPVEKGEPAGSCQGRGCITDKPVCKEGASEARK